jgi:uncharacterized membrane protein
MDSRKRSILKTLSYRAITTVTLAVITYSFTGDLFQTSAVSITFSMVATAIYYLHERLWTRIKL